MLQYARSPSSSPAHKRQRLSSPTYDEQVDDISDEHLQAFDLLEARLSQAPSSQENKTAFNDTTNYSGPSCDDESPFFTKASALKSSPGTSKRKHEEEDDDEHPSEDSVAEELAAKEKMYDSFLDSGPLDAMPLFQSAKAVLPGFSIPTFKKASAADKENGGVWMPSKEALQKAQQRMKVWEKDWDDLGEPVDNAPDDTPLPEIPLFSSAKVVSEATNDVRPTQSAPPPPLATPAPISGAAFSSAAAFSTPARPSPLGFSSQSKAFRVPTFRNLAVQHTSTPLSSRGPARSQSAFRPPLRSATPGPSQTPLQSTSRLNHETPSTPLRQAARPLFTTPGQAARPFATPRSVGLSRSSKATFKTPFKVPGSTQNPVQQILKHNIMNHSYIPPSPLNVASAQASTPIQTRRYPEQPKTKVPQIATPRKPVAAPKTGPSKIPLASCGLRPQEYDVEELSSMGVNIQELKHITPESAIHYGFYSAESTSPIPGSSSSPVLNAEAAYRELLRQGCTLATKPWVDNHWCMILWKLAGMAAFDPDSEQDLKKKRWCWAEVMRQLTYRYEKELDGAQRPALRRIVATDSPASSPLVLCVSKITWIEGERDSYPELEVTDGWYRLPAQIDRAMEKALRKGTIRVGRKLATVGAKLTSEKKEPAEILEASDSVKLVLSGNSTHLAPWHAKLGFQNDRYISSLRSLSGDGGPVSCIDVEILTVHPVAYLEFVTEPDGQRRQEGPRIQVDENRVADEWARRREKEASKLRYEYEQRNERYMDYIARLEGRARSFKPKEDDGPPDSIDIYYDDLEEHKTAVSTINRLSASEAYWLIKAIQQGLSSEHDRMNSEIEQELAASCPPRNVRNFRVLVVKDARTGRKTSHRHAQITVWDVDTLALTEGGQPGSFQVGQRYMISNLVPTQASSWMKDEPGAEIYLTANRRSQWLRIRD
ncbi:BRCA2, oligonucleotide/oligosaccharide-binding, domain 1-domain-containing protein [Coprinopsis sp. MPI-PUGE-AT-0042]|nr:BRCA2, oligonucleotide/oligosaccharide-binding, domain 1-domain-containing protein [Coprinopsis sp. MPI-PUGE-AT-0042]